MVIQNLKLLEKDGKVKRVKVAFIQIEKYLREALIDLEEARRIYGIVRKAPYLMAYMAMLKAGRALMFMEGYQPDDGGQHKTVIQITAMILGSQYQGLIKHFEIMRRKRNEMTYEASFFLTQIEVEKSLSDAATLVRSILNLVKSRNPQMEMNFEL